MTPVTSKRPPKHQQETTSQVRPSLGTLKLKNGFVVTPDGIKRQDLVIRKGRINCRSTEPSCEQVIDAAGQYILPGFVDIHTHGRELFDFTTGRFHPAGGPSDRAPETYAAALTRLARRAAAFGVTSFYLSSFAAAIETLSHCYAQLAQYCARHSHTTDRARLLGGFLEGTFIHPTMAGAQNPDFVFTPDIKTFDRIAGHESIKLVNVVPDYGPAGYRLTEQLTQRGLIVGAGHTNATKEQIDQAVKAGLKYCIHFTNGPTGNSYKPFHGGGAVEAVLQHEDLYAELILDGYHVAPAYVRAIIERKTPERIIAVTDTMFAAGAQLDRFEVGGVRGRAVDHGQCLFVEGKDNTLFGSCLTMQRGFCNLLNWLTTDMPGIWRRRHPACPFNDVLTDLTKMFATNPCQLLGLDQQGFGAITEGAPADLTILKITGDPGAYDVNVTLTTVAGNVIYRSDQPDPSGP